jgi:cytochrome c peroxidase
MRRESMAKKWLILPLIVLLIGVLSAAFVQASEQELSSVEQLGEAIFFDEDLSINQNQSCASCHGPEVGWTGPLTDTNAGGAVYEGSIADSFGDRKPPSAAYATLSPIFHVDKKGLWIGGNFWDGRATGEKLGNPAADQAQGPFINPVEQALPDSACVVYRVTQGSYAALFFEVWGDEASDIVWPADIETVCATEGVSVALSAVDRAKSDKAYDQIALSIAAYEASLKVNAFTSKYDYTKSGQAKLSKLEQRGFALFQGKGKCSKCHKNPENPAGIAPGFVDPGLGGFLKNAGYPEEVYEAEWGKHKVPTLRNVDLRPYDEFVKAYGHNGYFKSLEEIVHFYNTRDVEGAGWEGEPWPAPEVAENVNTDELGDLGLTPEEEAAIVAFLKALSDGFITE